MMDGGAGFDSSVAQMVDLEPSKMKLFCLSLQQTEKKEKTSGTKFCPFRYLNLKSAIYAISEILHYTGIQDLFNV